MLSRRIGSVLGVGERREKLFRRLGIRTVADLLYYFPRSYEDRSTIKKICDLKDGEMVCIKARAQSNFSSRRVRKNLSYQKITVADDTGIAYITWFNQNWIMRNFDLTAEYTYYGKVTIRGKRVEMTSPKIVKDNKIEPIYPLTDGLTQNVIRSAVEKCMPYIDQIPEVIPDWVKEKYTLCGIDYAIANIHFPETFEKHEFARYRLAFEELLILQLGLRLLKQRRVEMTGTPLCETSGVASFVKKLPFALTGAQKRVIDEILSDMGREKVMNRLVQGDVGSGKTAVSAIAMLVAAQSGYQAAMMAPTEILATQHFESLTPLLEREGITVGLLTGSQPLSQKREVCEKIENGEIQVVIGTHAHIQDVVKFKNLRLVVTDEQHRFGVKQRTALAEKGGSPHLLVMTATPIPRTLSLVLYGDLDVSIIDEMPPGRKIIKTYAVGESMRERINKFMLRQLSEGRQIYIVCPVIDESETLELKAATEYADKLKKTVPKDYVVGLMHGKLSGKEKDDIMSRFAKGEIHVLVSTTVIEVGVNVPNATLMIIENAERFGLSQLHQLRGRVGRGNHQSYCILFCQGGGEVTKQRMEIMQQTNDGFKIAEKDLQLRGPGDFFGTRQHGLPELKAANLYLDMPIIAKAARAAEVILSDDSNLNLEHNRFLRYKIEKMFAQTGEFGLN
jgi:ATP-dependent DNA helicase RecG